MNRSFCLLQKLKNDSPKMLLYFQIDVWTEMAKEMKSNFGSHRSKSIQKGSTGQGSGGNSSSFGLGIPHLPQQETNQTLEQDSIRPSSSPSDSEFSNVEVDPPFVLKSSSRANIRSNPKSRSRTFDMDEDPYGPMSSHFYPGGRPPSQSVLTSPTCAYHAGQHISGPISGSSADIRHYGVKQLNSRANRQYQSGTDLHGQG